MAYTPDEFARALERSIAKVPRAAVAVVRRGAKNVKDEGRRNSIASSGGHAAAAPFTIEYSEPEASGTAISSEIGYEGGGQAKLGVLLEYGGGGDKSPPHRDLGRALDSEEKRFPEWVAKMGEDVLPS